MSKTSYDIKGNNILINGNLTYSEIENSNEKIQGLLFNARFIQGIYEDITPENQATYNRFNKTFDKNINTQELIDSLPEWYDAGLRAITVGMQGGGPIYAFKDWHSINTNTFSSDGRIIEESHKERLLKIIDACDKIGMIVIVSCLYEGQSSRFDNEYGLVSAIRSTCEFLSDTEYTNIMIEVANENDIGQFQQHPMISKYDSVSCLVYLAREWSKNKFAIGCSCGHGAYSKAIGDASDIVLIHGNSKHRDDFYNLIQSVIESDPNKPIICNEDSQRITQLQVCEDTHISWGYYNNVTKQEPPIDWSITRGEDEFFAARLKALIHNEKLIENEFYLQGLEKGMDFDGKFYVRVASKIPEQINYVEYFEDNKLLNISYCDPFMFESLNGWRQCPYTPSVGAKDFKALVHLTDGSKIELRSNLNN